MSSNPRIALITTWYPPTNGVAVNRMYAFVKYLPKSYELVVYTSAPQSETVLLENGKVEYVVSKSFLGRFKHKTTDSTISHKFKSLVRLILIKLGSTELGAWKKNTFQKLVREHKKKPFDLILSSFDPVEAHQIAYDFCDQIQRIPWVADMRDEMSTNPFVSESISKKLRVKEILFEKYISAITTVSVPILEDFKKQFPAVKHFEEIRNGFDHEVPLSKVKNAQFTFVYAGTFYGKNKPDLFFNALQELIQENQFPADFQIHFVGTNHNFWIPKEFAEQVQFIPKVPQAEAVKYMTEADCNLLLSVPLGTMGRFTGKLFDYLSVEKPILALVDVQDVAAELIVEHHAGVAVDFYSLEDIKAGIVSIYSKWKNNEEYPIDPEKTATLHRRHQVKKMDVLIQKMIQS